MVVSMTALGQGKVRYRTFLYLCGLAVCYQFFSLSRLSIDMGNNQGDHHSMHPPNLHHNNRTKAASFWKVDILSIGSNLRLEYLQAQKNTFARHISVRHFFNATEDSDADPYVDGAVEAPIAAAVENKILTLLVSTFLLSRSCSQRLSKWNVTQISRFCHRSKKWNPNRQFLMSYLKTAYANEVWLRRKANSPGWMCAQTRPMQGLYHVLQFYETTHQDLPDYLVVMDDDTYYNLPLFHQYFRSYHPNPSKPVAVAGCRVRSPIDKINFTIPFGGYGLTLSKGYLSKLLRPIKCPEDQGMCRAIRRTNHLDERSLFESGMSIADLMYAYATNQPFVNFSEWTTGFCLHSDWLWGFISNFYNASDHTIENDDFPDVPPSRLEAYRGSELNAGDLEDHHTHGICEFQRGNCDVEAEACHYSTPKEMATVTEMVRRLFPAEFPSTY